MQQISFQDITQICKNFLNDIDDSTIKALYSEFDFLYIDFENEEIYKEYIQEYLNE